ncbi:BgtA-20906 [Blumeria graminis f. sp. tritici]|uniref:BgtA-20906 n=3 Tax=Blumeria graminis TaxID=34373 RepID=A0A9X9MLT7_BLUGR|nr:hypothetical protein BGT96224_A20906 [Blumeria graminis f. sp. tritici 96224]VDB92894.1 BgtA-20906 [Blumeria graminis f. sp. tritici]
MFADSDLETITAKQVRKALMLRVGKDLSYQKDAIQALIMERFDIATSSKDHSLIKTESPIPTASHIHGISALRAAQERPVKREIDDELSPDAKDTFTAKKRQKKKEEKPDSKEIDDEKLAKMLQAQENRNARTTRGTSSHQRRSKTNGKKSKLKKSKGKIKVNEDSDIDETGVNSEIKDTEGKKNNGFHKQYNLSAPLAQLLGTQILSRPQVVKNIWAYIKAQGLQDPTDKRQIICDDSMQLVFKQERVHMFTMNKILSKQLYDIED